MRTLWRTVSLAALLCAGLAPSATASAPPANPALASSSWPLFHRNTYAQASGDLDAIRATDQVGFQRLDNPDGGTSPWTVFPAPYPDGSQAVISNTQFGVIKWLIDGPNMDKVSYWEAPRGRMNFDWNVAVLATGEIVVSSGAENTLYFLKDERPNCPRCRLVVDRKVEVPQSVGQITVHFTVSYDGHILMLLEGDKIAAISPRTGAVVAVHAFGNGGGGYSYHNAFAVDETGRIFISSQQGVAAIDWTGTRFAPALTAPYDFRGPGCREPRRESRLRERRRTITGQNCTGTGTTPTLIGDPQTGLVVMIDGHAPQNNLVGFWRGDIPPDWRGRLAGTIALPHSTPEGEGFTAENSPAALGHSIFVAQWAGFRPDCDPPKGVQRVDWNPAARRFELVWSNPDVHFNGVPTASSRTGLVYGAGRGVGCTFAYRGLDIETGALRLDVPLGEDEGLTDQGNQQAIANDGSIVVGVRRGTLRIYREAP